MEAGDGRRAILASWFLFKFTTTLALYLCSVSDSASDSDLRRLSPQQIARRVGQYGRL
jgi:hypothetical protein